MAYKIKKIKYHIYEDPAHAWMKVERKELERLNLADKISPYSYEKGDNVYLEEDSDLTAFAEAKKEKGEDIKFVEHITNKSSKIRSYNSYKLISDQEKSRINYLKEKILTLPHKDWSKKAINKIKNAPLHTLEFWAKDFGIN
jgi:intergrase/recombinase